MKKTSQKPDAIYYKQPVYENEKYLRCYHRHRMYSYREFKEEETGAIYGRWQKVLVITDPRHSMWIHEVDGVYRVKSVVLWRARKIRK